MLHLSQMRNIQYRPRGATERRHPQSARHTGHSGSRPSTPAPSPGDCDPNGGGWRARTLDALRAGQRLLRRRRGSSLSLRAGSASAPGLSAHLRLCAHRCATTVPQAATRRVTFIVRASREARRQTGESYFLMQPLICSSASTSDQGSWGLEKKMRFHVYVCVETCTCPET